MSNFFNFSIIDQQAERSSGQIKESRWTVDQGLSQVLPKEIFTDMTVRHSTDMLENHTIFCVQSM